MLKQHAPTGIKQTCINSFISFDAQSYSTSPNKYSMNQPTDAGMHNSGYLTKTC